MPHNPVKKVLFDPKKSFSFLPSKQHTQHTHNIKAIMLMTMMTRRWISSVLLVQFVCRFDSAHHYNILHAEAFLLPSSLTRKSRKLKAQPVHPYDSGRPLSEILEELVEQGISFPPTANREELELLIKSSRGNSSTDINNYEDSKQRQRSPLLSTEKYASSSSSSTGRTSHHQSRRPLYQTKIGGNSDDDDDNIHENYYYLTNDGPDYNDYSNINNNGSNRGVSDRRRDRRQRRQQRQKQLYNEDGDILGSIYQTSKRVVPKKVISIGNKATSIASRKTKKLWKDLVDSTFDEETESGVQKGRIRKRSVSPERAAAAAVTTSAESKRQRRHGQNYDGRRKETAGSNYYDTPKREAATTTTTTTTTIPIQVILAELQAMSITFSPASSRQELEAMLSTAKQKQQQQQQQATKDPKFQDDENNQRTNSNNKKKKKAVPSQTKSRRRSGYSSTNPSIVVDAVIEDFSKDESIQGNMNIDNVLIPPRKDIENWDTRRQSSSAGSRVPSTRSDGNTEQRPRGRHEPNFDDEDDIWNKNRSVSTTSDSTTISANESDRQQPRKTRIPSESPSTSFGSMKGRSKIIQSSYLSPSQRPAAAAAAASFTGGDYTGQTTTSASTGRNEHSHQRRSRNPSKSESHRKIYSPRRRQPKQRGYNDDFDDEYRDGLDEFGDMLSNTVDSFLWGEREEDGEGSSSPTKRRRKRRKAINSKTGIPRSGGNWKDRMEEQLDRFMGIHEDGEYYNRWAAEDLEDEDNAGGTDAVSYAQGRAPKRNQRSTSKKRKKWVEAKRKEEAGGLLSFLFGTENPTPRRRSRSYPDKKDRSLVRLLRSAIRSFRFFAGALAQWASVRGAIPEQVVVIGTCSAGLCSFPGRKVRNMIVTLLTMRVIGEVLQGYSSEDDPPFWREDDGDEDDENDPED